MEFQTLEIDEKNMISEKGDFESCHDVVMYDDQISKDFLDEEQGDNILLIRKFGDMYKVDCYSRTSLKEIIKPRLDPPYLSKNCRQNDGTYQTFYPISIGGVECFFTKESIVKIIKSFHQIYYVEPKIDNNQIDCQGRMNTIYEVKVCGGENCLPQIFREDDEEEIIEEEYNEDDFAEDIRVSIDNNDYLYFENVLNRLEHAYGQNEIAYFLNERVFGLDLEPILIYAIKNNSWDIVERMLYEGASLDVDDNGVTPLVALLLFANDVEDFEQGLQTLFLLNEYFFPRYPTNIDDYFNKEIRLRRGGVYRNIIDFVDRYPNITERRFKSSVLRDVYDNYLFFRQNLIGNNQEQN